MNMKYSVFLIEEQTSLYYFIKTFQLIVTYLVLRGESEEQLRPL